MSFYSRLQVEKHHSQQLTTCKYRGIQYVSLVALLPFNIGPPFLQLFCGSPSLGEPLHAQQSTPRAQSSVVSQDHMAMFCLQWQQRLKTVYFAIMRHTRIHYSVGGALRI